MRVNDKNLLTEAFIIAEYHHFQVPIYEMYTASRTLDPILLAKMRADYLMDFF